MKAKQSNRKKKTQETGCKIKISFFLLKFFNFFSGSSGTLPMCVCVSAGFIHNQSINQSKWIDW